MTQNIFLFLFMFTNSEPHQLKNKKKYIKMALMTFLLQFATRLGFTTELIYEKFDNLF